jgi:ATP-dependent Clp protease adaptor protein ClpS
MPEKPPAKPPERSRTGRDPEGDVATQERAKVVRPKRFKVLLYNDDYTPMEFVVAMLEQVFNKGPAEATQLMLQIHRGGFGVAGVFVLEIAETKVSTVHRIAEDRGHPLRAGMEEE